MQAKMSKTRVHVASRITALTDILAPPVASVPASSEPSEMKQTSLQNTQSSATRKQSTVSQPQNAPQPSPRPPSYEEATLPPPSYRQTVASDDTGASLPRSLTSDSVTSVSSGEVGEILFSMGEVQVCPDL